MDRCTYQIAVPGSLMATYPCNREATGVVNGQPRCTRHMKSHAKKVR